MKIDQKQSTKILGYWIQEDAGKWSVNTRELVKSAYSRISMLSKLKYTGVSTKDLLEIYSLFIRSRAEYMSVVWHSSLTLIEDKKIENIQRLLQKFGSNWFKISIRPAQKSVFVVCQALSEKSPYAANVPACTRKQHQTFRKVLCKFCQNWELPQQCHPLLPEAVERELRAGGGEEGAGQAPGEGGGQGQEGGELDFYLYTTVHYAKKD